MDSALLWLLILGFAILMYLVLDGFDLGLGLLYPWIQETEHRKVMMNSIAHFWDGNETWLVFGGAILFAAFPAAYAIILSQLYVPLIIMLLALIFRGVAFEYRFKADSSTLWWDRSFWLGSSVAAFCQGIVLGTLVQGLPVSVEDLSATPWLWLSPFSLFTGLGVMFGYALLGCTWLVMKTEGELQIRAARFGRRLLLTVICFMFIVSLWMLLAEPAVASRWLSWPQILLLAPLPCLSVLAGWRIYLDLGDKQMQHQQRPFFLGIGLFALNFVGLVAGMYPYIVPRQVTIDEALAPSASLHFLLPGVLLLVPVILLYTLYGYRVFSGKVRPEESDH